MKVRAYQDGDFLQLTALYKNKAAYGGTFDNERDTRQKLAQTAGLGNLYVVENDDGVIVGSCMILDNPHTCWLLRFVIDPQSQTQQVVAELLSDTVLNIARERGHQSVIVYTDPSNQKLLGRYKALGFREASDYRCFWKEVSS